jgi:cysteine desulfurase
MKAVYLDNNSTTRVDERVIERMLPAYRLHYGNAASSTHAFGWQAESIVKDSRQTIAEVIGAEPQEIIFTSGASEAINIGLQGLAACYRNEKKNIVVLATEHKAVLDCCHALKDWGYEIRAVACDALGNYSLSDIESQCDSDTLVVAAMLANNETGVINPIASIAEIAHQAGAFLFCDATQAFGKMDVNIQDLQADLLSISAHKFYGPKGAGALYIRRKNPRVNLQAVYFGGGHERGLRPGTLNVPGIAGMALALEIAAREWWDDSVRISKMRTYFEQQLTDGFDVFINGDTRNRLCNTSNLLFKNILAKDLIRECDYLAVSSGSACTSALPEPSHVLRAMGLNEQDAYSSMRFSFGRFNTFEETIAVLELVKKAVTKLRASL